MTFSVIVPTHNRLASLMKTLESLYRQDFSDFEIIIVDDGSTDGTGAYLVGQTEQHKIRYVYQPCRGPAAARNAGFRVARAPYAAFTDDDCIVPRDWMKKLHAGLERTGADIIGGTVRNIVTGNPFSEMSQEITNHFVTYYGRQTSPTSFLTSNNIAYRAKTFSAAGGFNEVFRLAGGEERALHHAIIDNGGSSVLLQDLVIDHEHVLSWQKFLRQQRNYGRGSYLLHRIIKPGLNTQQHISSFPAYTSLMKSFFSSGISGGIRKLFLFLIAQSMVASGFFLQMFEGSRSSQKSLHQHPVKG